MCKILYPYPYLFHNLVSLPILKRNIKEYYEILERVNGDEDFIVVPSNDSMFLLYEELREAGLVTSSKDSKWKSGTLKEDGDSILHGFSPTIEGIKLESQLKNDLWFSKFKAFLWGVVVSAIMTTITYPIGRLFWIFFIKPMFKIEDPLQ